MLGSGSFEHVGASCRKSRRVKDKLLISRPVPPVGQASEIPMERPLILIADDHTLLAAAFKTMLEPEYAVIKLVSDGRKLLAATAELKPGIVLLDLSMPLLNGLDAGKELKKLLPRTKLIILTMNEDPDVASRALRSWASAFLLKKSAGVEPKMPSSKYCKDAPMSRHPSRRSSSVSSSVILVRTVSRNSPSASARCSSCSPQVAP